MKTRLQNLCLALLLASATGASAADVKLTGIVCLHFGRVALLEIKSDRPVPPARPRLRVGERAEGIELKSIDEKAARVTILDGERTVELSIDGQEGVANQTFNLSGADSAQLLEVYQDLSGRTVLRSPGLVGARIDLKTGAGLSPVEAEAALAGALQEKGTVLAMRYDKFAFAVPFSYVPRLASLPVPPAPPKPDDKTETISKPDGLTAGAVKFTEADNAQVLEIYQELSGRTLLHSPDLPRTKVTVRSQTPLSPGEATWMLETLLRLGGITLVPEGKFLFVLRTTRETRAPAISSNSALGVRDDEEVPPATVKLSGASGAQVLPFYAKLIGREAVLKDVPACRFTLRSQTPLTSDETIYALDAVAALNQVRFVVTGQQVRLLPNARLLKDGAP